MKSFCLRLKMQPKHLLKAFITAGAILVSSPQMSLASQANVMAGYYNLSAKTQRSSGSSSNLGIYQVSYQKELIRHLAVQLGYSLLMTEVVTGDLAFGPDIGLLYFPVSETEHGQFETDRILMTSSEILRPYIGLSFHQRQFQSVSAAYVGFGLEAGTAFYMSRDYDLRLSLRTMSLKGPNQAEATQTDLLVGVGFNF